MKGYSSREIIRILENDGWVEPEEEATTGSSNTRSNQER
jgi:predicted RNA binding protein YcfA (HicA-like mRNA interferase family)